MHSTGCMQCKARLGHGSLKDGPRVARGWTRWDECDDDVAEAWGSLGGAESTFHALGA